MPADIIEDYLREIESRLQVDPERKQLIVSEIRSHLRDKVYELQAAEPSRAQEEVARQVIDDFGNPHDLALAYAPGGAPVLKSASSGEIVMRFGRAVGRGTKAFLKGVAITLIVLLVVAAGVGAWAYYELKPTLEKNLPYTVFESYESCYRENCTAPPAPRTFYVHPEAREVRLTLSLDRPHAVDGELTPAYYWSEKNVTLVAFGTAHVTVRDPTGATLYNRTFSPAGGDDVRETLKWAPLTGNWTIAVEFEDFRGDLEIDVSAIGLPTEVGPLSEIF